MNRAAPLEREIELNRRATRAFERGQLELALAGYQGSAADLAGDRARRRDRDQSRRSGRRLPGPRRGGRKPRHWPPKSWRNERLAFSPAQRSSAAYLRALLFADADALPDASRLAMEALALCRASSCGGGGPDRQPAGADRLSLGGAGSGARVGAGGLLLNRKAKADEETANSLRTMADVHSALGELAEAGETVSRSAGPGQEARPHCQDPSRSAPPRRQPAGASGARCRCADLLPAGAGREPGRGERAGSGRVRGPHPGTGADALSRRERLPRNRPPARTRSGPWPGPGRSPPAACRCSGTGSRVP